MTTSLRSRARRRLALLAAVLLSSWAPALAQPPGLVTDRPDQTESAVTVPAGRYQIETGVLFTRDNSRRTENESLQVLGTLLRIGLSHRAELRVGFDGFISETLESRGPRFRRRADGLGDASIGAKLLIADEQERRPRIALLAATTVPIGDDEVSSDDYDPSIRVAMSKGLSNRIGLGWNIGVASSGGNEAAFYTLSSGLSVDENNGLFAELFGDDDGRHSFDTGWTHLLAPNAQIDLAIGAGLTSEAADWFAGIGFSVRLPN